MQLYLHVIVVLTIIVTILIKEKLGVPTISAYSQRGIIFPVENWDDCFLDEASTLPGVCKSLDQCNEVLKKWEKENIYPKTCYFIKKEQFVCCPPVTNTPKPTRKPDNITLETYNGDPENITKKPQNLFNKTSTKKPSNIFLDTVITDRSTTIKKPVNFNAEISSNMNKSRKKECDLQNQQKPNDDGQSLKPNEFPFMAALGWKSNSDNKIWYPCGGVLISSRFVLTAAHCAEIAGEAPLVVHLGSKNLTDSEIDSIKIKQFIKYPGYNVSTILNDIALVELEQEVNNSVACLWYEHKLPTTRLIALAFGQTRFGGLGTNQLLKNAVTAIDNVKCQQFYKLEDNLIKLNIVDAHLCAGDLKYFRETCRGNTGGPLIMELDKVSYVVGITAFDLGCSDLPPSIYTRISSYIEWIEQIIWPDIDVRFNKK